MNALTSGLRLRIDGSSQSDDVLFEERLSPTFLDLRPDDELSAASDIVMSGRAYRASEWVMIEGRVTVSMRLPCAVCKVAAAIQIPGNEVALHCPGTFKGGFFLEADN